MQRILLLMLCGIYLSLAAVLAAGAQEDDDTGSGYGPSLPWEGESPHWVRLQEFSAVKNAPFIGSAECLYCHSELKASFMRTQHARTLVVDDTLLEQQGCEACHGAGGAHAVLKSRGAIFAFDWKNPAYTNAICLRCHSWLTSRDEWPLTRHAGAGMKCTDCHNPHISKDLDPTYLLGKPEEQLCLECHAEAGHDFTRLSHHPVRIDAADDPGARALHCSDCHNLHAGTGPAMLDTERVQDTCLKCHIDKGGPFRFVHMSTQEGIGDGCLACHAAHGSDNAWLTLMDGRAQCVQCHTDRELHNQPFTCWIGGCHVSMHGSNSSPLFFK